MIVQIMIVIWALVCHVESLRRWVGGGIPLIELKSSTSCCVLRCSSDKHNPNIASIVRLFYFARVYFYVYVPTCDKLLGRLWGKYESGKSTVCTWGS